MRLDREMKQIRAEASVVSEGPAQNFESEPTSHSKASGTEPRSQGKALLDRIDERFLSIRSESDRSRIVAWAWHEVAKAKRHNAGELTAQQEQYWRLQAVQGSGGMDYRKAAERAGLSDKQVWAIRRNAGLNPRTGEPKAA